MGNCGGCCHKVRPRYKEHVRDIYPKNAKNTEAKPPVNFRNFVQYANSYPRDLPKLARYLAKQIKRDLALRDYDDVKIGCDAFLALMDACHSDHAGLSLYDQYVREIIELLFEDKNADCKILGCEMFNKFIGFHDQRSDYSKLEKFFPFLVGLCKFPKKRKQIDVRRSGIQSMIKMVQLNHERYIVPHIAEIIPAVLVHIESMSDKEGKHDHDEKAHEQEDQGKSLDELARECLEHIARLATLMDFERVVSPIFDYLDKKEWSPHDFVISSLKLIVDHANVPNADLFLSLLPRRIERWEGSMIVVTRIIEITRELVLKMRLDVGNCPYLMPVLIKQLLAVEEDENSCENAVIQCIGAYLHRIQNFGDSSEVIRDILDEANRCDTKRQKRSLLRAACHAARLRPAIPEQLIISGNTFIQNSIVEALAQILGETKDAGIRISVNCTIQNLLLPTELLQLEENGPDVLSFSEESQKIYIFLNRLNDSNNPLPPLPRLLAENQLERFKYAIYNTLSESAGNSAETVQSCFRTLIVFLHMGDHSDFINETPMIFKLQELAVKTRPSSPQHALRLHTFVAAYILFISRVFANHNNSDVRRQAAMLDERIGEIIKMREDSGQICPDLVISNDVGLKAIRYDKEKLVLKSVETLIDENEMIAILHQFPVASMNPSQVKERLSSVFDAANHRISVSYVQDEYEQKKMNEIDYSNLEMHTPSLSRKSSEMSRSPSASTISSAYVGLNFDDPSLTGIYRRDSFASEASLDELDYDKLRNTHINAVNSRNQAFEEFMSRVDVTGVSPQNQNHSPSSSTEKNNDTEENDNTSPIEIEMAEHSVIDVENNKSKDVDLKGKKHKRKKSWTTAFHRKRGSRVEMKTPPVITVSEDYVQQRGSSLSLPDPTKGSSSANLDNIYNLDSLSSNNSSHQQNSHGVRVAKTTSSTLVLKFPKLGVLDMDDMETEV